MERYTADGYGAQQGEMMPDPEGPWVLYTDTLPRRLTEADPEPAVGSVVLVEGWAYVRDRRNGLWYSGNDATGSEWANVWFANGPVRLIWDGASDE